MVKKGHVASLTSARVMVGFMCFCFAWSQSERVPFTPPMPNPGVEQFTFAERVRKTYVIVDYMYGTRCEHRLACIVGRSVNFLGAENQYITNELWRCSIGGPTIGEERLRVSLRLLETEETYPISLPTVSD